MQYYKQQRETGSGAVQAAENELTIQNSFIVIMEMKCIFFLIHVVSHSSLCLKWSAILSGPVEVYRQISGSDFRRCVIVMQAHGVSLV